jgi:glycosyltransferase involved in cell wall biosynthesis
MPALSGKAALLRRTFSGRLQPRLCQLVVNRIIHRSTHAAPTMDAPLVFCSGWFVQVRNLSIGLRRRACTISELSDKEPEVHQYRIDFALIMITGNLNRYLMTRPIVESDSSVVSRWFPIRTWVHGDILRFLPGMLRIVGRHFLDSWRFYCSRPADAAVIHAFETYAISVLLHKLMRSKTVIVKNPDGGLGTSRKGLRGVIQRKVLDGTDLFVPWSRYAASEIREGHPYIPDEKIMVLHPGLDLSRWPMRPDKSNSGRFKILFVGGDPVRKGLHTLLDAFDSQLSSTCELHIACASAWLPDAMKSRILQTPNCHVHVDLTPASEQLQRLFRQADVFVLPTEGDLSPWVAMEAMATGLPVVITPIGGIPEIVVDGETGILVPPRDADAVAKAVHRLHDDAAFRHRLTVQGRRHIETHFDGRKNTEKLLTEIKRRIDARSGVSVDSGRSVVAPFVSMRRGCTSQNQPL